IEPNPPFGAGVSVSVTPPPKSTAITHRTFGSCWITCVPLVTKQTPKTGSLLVRTVGGVWISGKVIFRFAKSIVPFNALLGAVAVQLAALATARPPLAALGTRKALVKVAKSPVNVRVVLPVIAGAQFTLPLLVGPLMQFNPVLASRSFWLTLIPNAPRKPDLDVLRVPLALFVTNTAPGGFAGRPLPVRSISSVRDNENRPKLVRLTNAKFGSGEVSATPAPPPDACAVICSLALGLVPKALSPRYRF